MDPQVQRQAAEDAGKPKSPSGALSLLDNDCRIILNGPSKSWEETSKAAGGGRKVLQVSSASPVTCFLKDVSGGI